MPLRNPSLFKVPNYLGETAFAQEKFINLVSALSDADQYQMDFSDVSFLYPYGVVILFLTVRTLYERSHKPVQMVNLQELPYLYLERADFFRQASSFISYSPPSTDTWERNPNSLKILELTTINGVEDTIAISEKAKRIFGQWLDGSDLGPLVNVLSELCSNIQQHSEDSIGCAIIQTYQHPSRPENLARLAVGDLGCGVRASLSKRFSDLPPDDILYLSLALNGKSSRDSTRRGGMGLRTVRKLANKAGGSLWLRSGTAAISDRTSGRIERTDLADFRGTQLAITLKMLD